MVFIWIKLKCNLKIPKAVYYNPQAFILLYRAPFLLLISFLYNQAPWQPLWGSFGCCICQGEEEQEGGAGGQAAGGMFHAVTSRRIGLLFSCQAGVEVTSISPFYMITLFFSYSLLPMLPPEASEGKYLQIAETILILGLHSHSWRQAAQVIADQVQLTAE